MAAYDVKDMDVTPHFDLELLMSTCQETRIDGEIMRGLAQAWDRWLPRLHVRHIDAPKNAYLLVWLDESVEDDVDDKWEEAPSEAFIYNGLAQVMIMGAVHDLLPQVEDAGCAPAPHPTDDLADALEAEGVPYVDEQGPTLGRRYAVATYYPFKGGCEICTLQKDCPKAAGEGVFSVTLPGYE